MVGLVVSFLVGALLAVPVTMGLGVVYLAVAIGLVNFFRLNYGEKPKGFLVLNFAVLLTIISYFVVFAFLVRRF